MTRIGELISDLCPGGVEFRPLRDLISKNTGGGTPSRAVALYWDGGIPWASVGDLSIPRNFISSTRASISADGLANSPSNVIPRGEVIVAMKISPGKMKIAATDIAINQDLRGLRLLPSVDSRFLTYFFQTISVIGDGTIVRGITTDTLERIRVPVPPLEVQGEIVRILDTFTELEAQLEAELEARRRQHAYYWNRLLTPDGGWRRTKLGDIADIFDGPHATARKTAEGPWYLSISSLVNGRFDLSPSARIDPEQFDRWTRRVAARVGDTMFTYETRLGQAAYWDRNEPAALGRRMGVLRPKASEVFPRFLTLLYLGPEFQGLIRSKTIRGATVERFPIARMGQWPVSLPPLQEQRRIVEILDKFDALVNDLAIGLPAELAARRKQYEYYRDRLLTFEEAA